MPYIPSRKTNEKCDDREKIDAAVVPLAKLIARKFKTNSDLPELYFDCLRSIGKLLINFELNTILDGYYIEEVYTLANTIYEVGKRYNYDGAFLGKLNYAVTTLIQEVPKELVSLGKSNSELRYWLYAKTVSALTKLVSYFNADIEDKRIGIAGVFEDIKDEYKVRVNQSYEIEQIIKSGDCYSTPYYNKPLEVVDEDGKSVGYVYVNVKRSEETLNKDVITAGRVVLIKRV